MRSDSEKRCGRVGQRSRREMAGHFGYRTSRDGVVLIVEIERYELVRNLGSFVLRRRGVERRRLLDLGLVPGTLVRAEFTSPSVDPVAYRVRGALIALRTQQADMIHIAQERIGET